jgi:uncharacterized membrane protein
MTAWLLGLALFVGLLAILAAVADWWDARPARDARRRNPRRHVR